MTTCSYLATCSNPPAPGSKKCADCLAARREYALKWREANAERVRAQRRALYEEAVAMGIGVWSRNSKRYGLTREQYVEMLEQRNRLCDICGQPETSRGNNGKVKNLAIDHDHETDRVRGLLCNNCNRALGLLKDDVETLLSAVRYLRAATGLMA